MQRGKGYCLKLKKKKKKAKKAKLYFKLVLSDKEFHICWLELLVQEKGGWCYTGRRFICHLQLNKLLGK